MRNGRLVRRSLNILSVLGVALLTMAGDCQPVDDDDATPIDGNVTIVGGGVYETIQEAIDAASPGATIQVSAGLYNESLTIEKPLTLAGESSVSVTVTGDGDGTIVSIDQVTDALQITGIGFVGPYDEIGTARGLRITDSADVLLHDLFVGFEVSEEGTCDRGLSGIEISRSTVVISETDVLCVGFQSDNGGTGILAQTDADLTVLDSDISAVGSFGIRTIDAALTVSDTTIQAVNRPPNAENFESDGSAIYVEQASENIVLDGVTIFNGAYVGIWVAEAPALTVSASEFSNFAYGIYYPGGDQAAAAGRTLTLTGSTFTDLYQESVLSIASSTVSGSTFQNETVIPDPNNGSRAGGLRIIGPGAVVDVSGNVFNNLGLRALGIYGSTADGHVLTANIVGNTVTNVTAGNGMDLQQIESVLATDNIIDGVDHEYFDDDGGPNAGSINTGFGLDCFFVDSCVLQNNQVSNSEFGNYVMLSSGFSSTGDVSTGGLGRGFHAQTSNGTIDELTVTDSLGFGVLLIDSIVQGTGGTITGGRRGPSIQDIDGNEDPLPEELAMLVGGTALWAVAQGDNAETHLIWHDAVIEDNINGGVQTIGARLELVGNTLRNNGFYEDPENDPTPDSVISVSGYYSEAADGPLIENNVLDGGEGYWGVYISTVPGLSFVDNTVCVGGLAGTYVRNADGGVISGNSIGTTEDSTITSCDSLDWNYGLYLSSFDPSLVQDGLAIVDNSIAPPSQQYGVYLAGFGPHDFSHNTIVGGSTAGIYATMTLPTGLTSDNDLDGLAEYQGDCDDTDSTIGGASAVEVEADGIDNDCDGVTDDGLSLDDADSDGFTVADGDCNDTDASVNPGATEQIGNFRDDNCDGWADFDADLPEPSLSMTGNSISGSNYGLSANGATLDFLEPDEEELPNTLSDLTGPGIYLNTYTWSNTPITVPGTVTMGASTVVQDTAESCIRLLGDGTSATLTGTTLAGCGGHGIDLSGAGTVVLDGATLDLAAGAGISALQGSVSAFGGTTISSAGAQGVQISGTAIGSLDGVVITEPTSTGLSVLSGSATVGVLTVSGAGSDGVLVTGGTLDAAGGLQVTGATGNAVFASGGVSAIDGASLTDSLGTGVSVTGGEVVLGDVTISGAQVAGINVSGGSLSAGADLEVLASVGNGIQVSGGSVDLAGSSIADAGLTGISLSGTCSAALDGLSVQGSGDYGIYCDGGIADPSTSDVTLDPCVADADGTSGLADFELVNGCELAWSCTDP